MVLSSKFHRSGPCFWLTGMQTSLWSEVLFDNHLMEKQALPRLLAFAERAWHKASWEEIAGTSKGDELCAKDYEKFANVVGHKELRRLEEQGMTYYLPPVGAL